MRRQRQVLRLLKRIALQECKAGVPYARDVAIVRIARRMQAHVQYDGILSQPVEVGNALDQHATVGGDGGELALTHRLEGRQERVGIVADGQDVADTVLGDEAVGLVGGVLAEEGGELGVGLFGGLDGDDGVGGEVGDAGDCSTKHCQSSSSFPG